MSCLEGVSGCECVWRASGQVLTKTKLSEGAQSETLILRLACGCLSVLE